MAISVIVPNWNGAHLLPQCLDSLRAQTVKGFETIVVDDASADCSVALLQSAYPEVRVVQMARNSGFAAAANRGIADSARDIVVLLNNDVEVHPEFIGQVDLALARHPAVSAVAAKILLADRRRLHSAGDFYGLDGVPGSRGVWAVDEGQFDRAELVFGACAAAAAYRRSMLLDVAEGGEVFDESLFMYCEDVDLAFRAQLLGHKCLYQPDAVAYHKLTASAGGSLSSYYCGRNFLLVFLKNMPQELLRRCWPRFAAAQLRQAWESFRHAGEPAARARLHGQVAAWLWAPRFLGKRRSIQQRRRVTPNYIFDILMK